MRQFIYKLFFAITLIIFEDIAGWLIYQIPDIGNSTTQKLGPNLSQGCDRYFLNLLKR
jgi:hypothetical protein